jgi:hypothetical protein
VSDAQVIVSNGGNTHSRKLDANAVAEFAGISAGAYGVTVMGRPFGWERRIVLVEPGSTTEFDLEVGGGVTIEGQLVDAAGTPLGNAPEASSGTSSLEKGVGLGRAETGTVDRSSVHLTDDQGRIRIPVEPGLYLLRARVAGAASTFVTVDARQGSVEGVEVRALPPVAVVLRPNSRGGDAALPGPRRGRARARGRPAAEPAPRPALAPAGNVPLGRERRAGRSALRVHVRRDR